MGDPRTGIATEIVIGVTSVSTSLWGDGTFGDEGNIGIKFHRQILGLAERAYSNRWPLALETLRAGVAREICRGTYTLHTPKSATLISGRIFFPLIPLLGLEVLWQMLTGTQEFLRLWVLGSRQTFLLVFHGLVMKCKSVQFTFHGFSRGINRVYLRRCYPFKL